MSEYFVDASRAGDGTDPMEPPLPGVPDEDRPTPLGQHVPVQGERVRLGLPFNDVVPLWYEGTDITWHRVLDGTDLSSVLGLGHVETVTGPSPVPDGWAEQVEVGTVVYGEPEEPGGEPTRTLRLRATSPTGRRAVNDPGDGAAVPLSAPLPVAEAMEAPLDADALAVHTARLMLRAARDGAILLFTLRAPRDPEAHHLLSVPAQVDSQRVMRFHLGTLMEMTPADGVTSWLGATREGGMTMLDLTVPYESLLAGDGPEAEQGLDAAALVRMARPVVDCLLKPGFPFALGASVVLPVAR